MHAEYVDFEKDGVDELLLVIGAGYPDNDRITHSTSIEILGVVDGHAVSFGVQDGEYAYGSDKFALCESENRVYIHEESWDGGSGSPTNDYFYTVENNTLKRSEGVQSIPYYGETHHATLDGASITEAEYDATLAKYTELHLLSNIFFSDWTHEPDGGVLPELLSSSLPERQTAFLKLLKEDTENLVYARLIDFDQDGTEDLLLLKRIDEYNSKFSLYLWDGGTARLVDLTQLDTGYNENIGHHSDKYEINMEKASGKPYVCYYYWDNESITKCFESATDTISYSSPRILDDFDYYGYYGHELGYSEGEVTAMLESFKAEQRATERKLDDRYELVEKVYARWADDYPHDRTETINQVARRLAQNKTAEDEEKLLYFVEHCDTETFDRSYIFNFDKDMCMYARNAIYARAGRKFSSDEIRAYFEKFDWYKPTIEPNDFQESMLNEHQVANKNLMVAFESELGYR